MSGTSAAADSVLFAKACSEAASYPKNLVRPTSSRTHLERYFNRLHEQSERLFCEEGQAAVNLWDYDGNIEGFQSTQLSSHFELKGSIEGASLFSRTDPKCRFIFIHANHSRDRLRISQRMLNYILTYHQVMPTFLDFVFPFGLQKRLEDFYFSGLRDSTRLRLPDRGLSIPELGRSGRDFRLCYNLKSVEASNKNPDWPWSIRQTAVYHSFDLEMGNACWIVVKGNQLFKDRLQAATTESSPGIASPNFGSIQGSFASSLAAHLIISDWADEDWRWYLNYLESEIENMTARTIIATNEQADFLGQSHIRETTSHRPRRLLRAITRFSKGVVAAKPRRDELDAGLHPQNIRPQHLNTSSFRSPHNYLQPVELRDLNEESGTDPEDGFSARDIQRLQYLEEKANEVAMVMQFNRDILTQLKEFYTSLLGSEYFLETLGADCKADIVQFEKRIDIILADFQSQHLRTGILLKTLNDRKTLISSLMDYQSNSATLASKYLAQKAQSSAERMEMMTKSMHGIAERTKQEALSMRIITLVTLCYLPGTFISTIMSTDIVKFQDGTKMFQHGALQLYLMLTIPFTVVTFAVWYGMYLWAKHLDQTHEKDDREEKRHRVAGHVSVV